jgi:hypothetical protein
VESGAADAQTAQRLGGMTRLLGAVQDGGETILAGLVETSGEGCTLDDLANALRSLVLLGQYPLVSIDKTPETFVNGVQKIRVEGANRSGMLAAKLICADITLKKSALGDGISLGFPSYFDLTTERARSGASEGHVSSRLWFHAEDSSLLLRPEACILQRLRIGVRTEQVSAAESGNDEPGERFAAAFTSGFEGIAVKQASIGRLYPVFGAVAIARGMSAFREADLDYWLHGYAVCKTETPTTYPLLRREVNIEKGGRVASVLEVNGGVDTRVFAARLRDGEWPAFAEAVVKSRPSRDALLWAVPLDGWRYLPTGSESTPSGASMPGTHLDSTIRPASTIPSTGWRGGIDESVNIDDGAIRRKP